MLHPDGALLSIEAMCRGVATTAVPCCHRAVSPRSTVSPTLSPPAMVATWSPPLVSAPPLSPPSSGSPSPVPSRLSPESRGVQLQQRCDASPGSPGREEPRERRASTSDDSGAGSGCEEAPPPSAAEAAAASEADGGRRRPARTVFSVAQMEALEREYAASRYLSTGQRRLLSRRLQLAEPTVKVWFQNRRMKEKRQQSETHMHYLSQLMQQYVSRLQWAGAPPPPPPAHSQLPLQPLQLAAVQYAAAGLTPAAVTSPAAAAELVTSPSHCRPSKGTAAHRHLFRPYAL